MPVTKTDLIQELTGLINLFSHLVETENFDAYRKLRSMHTAVLKRIEGKEQSQISQKDFEALLNSTRIFMEAPPKDEDIDSKVLESMNRLYKMEKSFPVNS